jgi:hypothetical protein
VLRLVARTHGTKSTIIALRHKIQATPRLTPQCTIHVLSVIIRIEILEAETDSPQFIRLQALRWTDI